MTPENRRGVSYAVGAQTLLGSSMGVSAFLVDFPVATGQALRYSGAAILLYVVMRHLGLRLLKPTRGEWVRLCTLAFFGQTLFNLLLIEALDRADPATVGSILGCSPVLLAVLGPLLVRRRPNMYVIAASLVVVAGGAIVQGFGGGTVTGLLLACGVTVCEAAFSLVAIPLLPRFGAVRIATYSTALAVPQMMIVAVAGYGDTFIRMPTGLEVLAFAYMAVPVTAGAFLLWYSSLGLLGPERAGLLSGLVPIVAALSGLVLGTGAPTAGQYAGAALVGVGVALGMQASRAPAPVAVEQKVT